MHISGILQQKGSGVTTIEPDQTVASAARMLAVHHIGALVVSRDGEHIDGIVSERDITHAVGLHGAELLTRPVSDVMTREVTTCGFGDTVDELMEIMTAQRIRHLPVVAEGRLAGLVSIGDVVKHRLSELKIETQTLHEYLTSGR